MDKTITRHLPKTFLLLGIAAFTAGCSTQSISIPGSQLIGQNKKDCIDKKTGKAIPGCITDKGAADTAAKRKPLVLLADKPAAPAVTSPTIITAVKAPATTNPTLGVVASEAKVPQPVAPLMTQPRPAPVTVPVIPTPKAVVAPAPKPAVVQTETTRRLTLSGSANFKTGSSVLNQSGKDKLAALARTLSGSNTKISRLLIEGHTDSVGAAAANQVLSLKRANAVADYLASQGLIRSFMETAGKGEGSPIADNKTKAGRAQNRRVEITATGTRQTNR